MRGEYGSPGRDPALYGKPDNAPLSVEELALLLEAGHALPTWGRFASAQEVEHVLLDSR